MCKLVSCSDFDIPTSANFSFMMHIRSEYISGFSPSTIVALMYSRR